MSHFEVGSFHIAKEVVAVILHLNFNMVNTVLLPVTVNVGVFMIFGVFEWIGAFFGIWWSNQ